MKKITDVQQQRQNKDKFNIYINNEYCFSCSLEIVALHNLKVGLMVDEDKLKEIIYTSNIKAAFNMALTYLSTKPRTKAETIKHLMSKGYEENVILETLKRLEYYNYINDEDYAKNYVKNNSMHKLNGIKKIKHNLKEKGIDENLADIALDKYDAEQQLQNAIDIGKRFFLLNTKTPVNKIKEKLYNKLLMKGYLWDTIDKAISIIERDEVVIEELDQMESLRIEEAKKLVEKYFKQYSKRESNSYVIKNKVAQALFRKGYKSDLIKDIINDY
ncbi:RecX family transcriptional regulator [Alkaliphilus pronyensis]|nr:RecX family transcriptional regulator [Alkaliphilus pronyensis]